MEELGALAATILLDQLVGGSEAVEEQRLLRVELVSRQSVARLSGA